MTYLQELVPDLVIDTRIKPIDNITASVNYMYMVYILLWLFG